VGTITGKDILTTNHTIPKNIEKIT